MNFDTKEKREWALLAFEALDLQLEHSLENSHVHYDDENNLMHQLDLNSSREVVQDTLRELRHELKNDLPAITEERSFGHQFTKFFREILEKRSSLLKLQVSKTPFNETIRVMSSLSTYKSYNWNNEGAAKFLLNNYNELRMIIPGREKEKFDQLKDLFNQSQQYL